VRGAEFDGNARLRENISVYGAFAYTEGTYTVFTNAPPPLEETGGPLVKDISGSSLPGISKWGASLGGEIVKPGSLFGRRGEFFAGVDASHRSAFSSSPSASRYLIVEGYALLNGRVGFRASDNWSLYLWGRNLLDREYFDFLSGVGGNSGLYVGLPGDPRTFGITLRRGL
jgi:iron complex outermembrane receptor protein